MTEQRSMPSRDSLVSLREVTKETVRAICRLQVKDTQTHYVAPNAVSIAQAYFDREHAWFRAVYADESPVGFVMVYDDPENKEFFIWRFMIDQRYQGLGYGRRAMELLLQRARTRPNIASVTLSCDPDEHGPQGFYKGMGFVATGEMVGDEQVMKLELESKPDR